jgi:hypothetical protein
MKLDVDPFPVNTVVFVEKEVLVRTDQASTTKGKNVIVSDELRNQMIKPRSPEVVVWKENTVRKPAWKVKPTSSMLINKYMRRQQWRASRQVNGIKRTRSPSYHHAYNKQDAYYIVVPPRTSWVDYCRSGGESQWVYAWPEGKPGLPLVAPVERWYGQVRRGRPRTS